MANNQHVSMSNHYDSKGNLYFRLTFINGHTMLFNSYDEAIKWLGKFKKVA